MKVHWPIITLAAFGAALLAQTPAPAPDSPERALTQIFSDTVDFDLKTRTANYRGNVRVEDPQMKLTCAVLTAKIPESGGKIDHLVAEQNVVIDMTDAQGKVTHATGDKLVYSYVVAGAVTNETVELTGNPRLESAQGSLTGEVIVWDKARDRVSARHQKMEFRASTTNSVPSLFNKPADAKK